MTTKERIIDQAITSYNRLGVTNVTSRDLAQALDMSHGNLEYHFANKEVLLKAIYGRMRDEVSKSYGEMDTAVDPLIRFNELLLRLEQLNATYSFFNLDVLEISRNFTDVDGLLKKTFLVRKKQTALFFSQFREKRYLKAELRPGMYLRLQHTLRILITFWQSQQEVLSHFAELPDNSMRTHIWELLVPNMTDKGLRIYHEHIESTIEK